MRISETRATRTSAARGRGRASSSSSSFHLDQASSMPKAAAMESAQQIHGIEALLSVQGIEDPLVGRRKALQRGEEMLDILDKVKVDILSGRVSPERLENLYQTVLRRTPSDNAQIDSLLAEIELRARVELAKLGKFTA